MNLIDWLTYIWLGGLITHLLTGIILLVKSKNWQFIDDYTTIFWISVFWFIVTPYSLTCHIITIKHANKKLRNKRKSID